MDLHVKVYAAVRLKKQIILSPQPNMQNSHYPDITAFLQMHIAEFSTYLLFQDKIQH